MVNWEFQRLWMVIDVVVDPEILKSFRVTGSLTEGYFTEIHTSLFRSAVLRWSWI